MIYCQECGSEIAEAEKFCPYCGISLQSNDLLETTDANTDSKQSGETPDFQNSSGKMFTEPENVSEEYAVDLSAKAEEIDMSDTADVNDSAFADTDLEAKNAGYSDISIINLDAGEEVSDDDRISAEKSDLHSEDAESGHPYESFSDEQKFEPVTDLISGKAFDDDDDNDSDANESVAETVSGVSDITDEVSILEPEISDDAVEYAEEEIDISLESTSSPDKIEPENNSETAVAGLPDEADSKSLKTEHSSEKMAGEEHINEQEKLKESDNAVDKPYVSDETSNKLLPATTPDIGGVDTDGSSKSKLKPLEEGTLLNGRYEITRKIGGGGMGAVYLANDKNLGDTLRAVKEMVQSYIEEKQQEKAVNDFKRESLLLSKLDHPAIPTIYDYFFDQNEGRFYLVMKYISGGDLAGRIRSSATGKIDELSVTDWACQIADVLEYLHTQEPVIVYRDLKPANVMIDGNTDRVMLIDFGIARSINKIEKGVTAVGTMGYAPPELFSGNVQPSSDIYSLGSTMFHLLTGADPQNNPLLIFDFQKHPRPRQINPQISDQMEKILMRAVEYNAEKRFNSAAEMKNILKDHLENLKAGKVSYGVGRTPQTVALADESVFCGFCGQKIVATDMFCAFCGAKQPLAQTGVHSQDYHVSQATAKLMIEGTSELEFPAYNLVKNENLVGRRDPMSNIFPEVDLSKFDPQTKISRKHARIWRNGDKFMLEDLGSSNGTYLKSALSENRRLIPNQSQTLENGDKIKLGDTTLQFIVG